MKIDAKKYPNCASGHQYALDVVSGKQIACVQVKNACKRYLRDLSNPKFFFDLDKAERYLKLVQLFEHVKGKNWKTATITYEPWQNFIFMNIMGFIDKRTNERRFRLAHIEVARGGGKAHPITQKVVTPSGIKQWGEIEIGDELYTRDGSICKVIRKTPITEQKVWEVVFDDGEIIECSGEHEWITSDKTERVRKTRHTKNPPIRVNKAGEIVSKETYESVRETKDIAKNLRVRGETNHAVGVTSSLIGETEILGGMDLYPIGYWLGNGGGDASITAHKEDGDEVLQYLAQAGIECYRGKYQKEDNSYTIRTRGLRKILKDLGIFNKNIPENWVNLKYSQRLSLFQGLLDSDGSIASDKSVEFYNGNLSILKGFRLLASSLGYKTTMNEKKVRPDNNFKPTRKHYRVSFTPRGDTQVFRLKRKAERQVRSRGVYTYTNKRYIVDVRDTGRYEQMFCVEVDSPDNTYLIGETLVPTHNSLISSQMVLYFLALDNPKGNEIACAATKKEQARIVLDSARAMAKSNPKFLRATGVEVLAHKIVHDKSNSVVQALSSDHDSLDGRNDILCVMDELHAISRELFDVIYSGMKKRNDSLMLCITTAGFNTDSVGHSQSQYARKVASGEVEDDTFFGIVYTIDEGDDIFAESTWIKANPNYGVSVDPIAFEATAKKAQVTPSDLPNFKVKNLNIWISEANAYFDLAKWDLGADPKLRMGDFRGLRTYIGIDLASKIDLACYVFVFKKDGIYYAFARSYLPEERLKEIRNTLLDEAVHNGYLTATPGEAINYERIQEDLLQESKEFNVLAAHYDPWNAAQFAQELSRKRLDMVEFRMTTGNLSEPMKMLDALIREGKFRHNGDPILRWCLGNVVAKADHNDNVFPRKSHEALKIDVAVALIMALAGWIQNDSEGSIYEEQGMRVLSL